MNVRYPSFIAFLFLAGCATGSPEPDPTRDGGLLWVKHSAEYRAITEQVYAKATRDLPGFIDHHHGWHAAGFKQLDLLTIKIGNAMLGIG